MSSYKEWKYGNLILDEDIERLDIRYDIGGYYGGLHCGTTLEIEIKGKWIATRVEHWNDWYLVGLSNYDLDNDLLGSKVRIRY